MKRIDLRATTLFCCMLGACAPGTIGADPAGPRGAPTRSTPSSPTAITCEPGAIDVGARPMRRLSPFEYVETVRALVGDPGLGAIYDDASPAITERGVRQLREQSEAVLARRAEWTETVFPCDLSGAGEPSCITSFLDGFGARAFRGPLAIDDRTWLEGVYGDARAAGLPFDASMDVLLQVVLAAPRTVYLEERGTAREGLPPGVRQLTDWELASRLSYFLWDAPPDDTLRELASRGALGEPAMLRAQVERMLEDPRAEASIQRFVWEWLQLGGGRLHHALEDAAKDPSLFPGYGPELSSAMRAELEAFVRRIVLEEDASSLSRLFTATTAYVNGPLAELYGVDGPSDPATWQWVELDPAERAGLLTRAAFLTVFASARVPTPIRRGVVVIEEILCNDLGDPPADVNDSPLEGSVEAGVVRSVREEVIVRTDPPLCQTCHATINPIGFTFERYDAIGAWQDVEQTTGADVDSSGALIGSDVDGPMADAVELSRALGASARVRSCFADRFFREALGDAPGEHDECAARAVREQFERSGSIRELIVAITESSSFRYLRVEE
jgi:hypothetical protein